MGVLYLSAAWLNTLEIEDMDPVDMFTAVFCMVFGAFAAGQANQFGPDMGKAKKAAEKVFKIADYPSSIDASLVSSSAKIVDPKVFKGTIEFKDVWFRYPTRPNDWVFKGLNLKIEQNDCIAIVGESG